MRYQMYRINSFAWDYIAVSKKLNLFGTAEDIDPQQYQLASKMISGSNTVLIVPLITPFDFRNRVRPYKRSAIVLIHGRTLFKADQNC